MNKNIVILAIDTSCDETSVAVTVNDRVVSNVISSQVELHKKWGGVVPILAKRAHEERIGAVVKEAMQRAEKTLKKVDLFPNESDMSSILDAVAVTVGPGLAPALEVGIRFAKEFATKHSKLLVAVNHMEGHLLSSFAKNSKGKGTIRSIDFPFLGLLVSGGHTQLVVMRDFGKYELLGETLDDAVGEAFDKVSKMLELGYPGGPIIERLAKGGDETAYNLPIPMRKRHDENFSFSYSGIKTALMYLIKDLKKDERLDKKTIENISASFQRVVSLSLVDKLELAVGKIHPKGILLGGGVISNLYIRSRIQKAMKKKDIPVYIPYSSKLFTDNAAMIGISGYYQVLRNDIVSSSETMDRKPNFSF
jgi:N6-L-threonylcarbamoyladenine synthase